MRPQSRSFERRICAQTQDLQIFKKFNMSLMNPKEAFQYFLLGMIFTIVLEKFKSHPSWRGERQAITIYRPNHILLIFQSEPPLNRRPLIIMCFKVSNSRLLKLFY